MDPYIGSPVLSNKSPIQTENKQGSQNNAIVKSKQIESKPDEGKRITQFEATVILYSISLTSYSLFYMMKIIQYLNWEIVISIQSGFILIGMISVYLLQDVKREHKNQLGTFQEALYFYS